MPAGGQVFQRPECVEPGEQRRWQSLPGRVQPQRARPGQDAHPVPGPDAVRHRNTLRVVPHPLGVHHSATGAPGEVEAGAVRAVRHTGEQVLGQGAGAVRPGRAHQVMVRADPSGGQHDGVRGEFHLSRHLPGGRLSALGGARGEHVGAHTGDPAVGDHQLADLVPEPDLQQTLGAGEARRRQERGQHPGPGAPGDVEPGQGVPVPAGWVATAFGPLHQREPAHPELVEPFAHRPAGEVYEALGPGVAHRIGPLAAIGARGELGRTEPVGEGQLGTVPQAETALLGGVHQEQPAERPERLSAERCGGFGVQDDDPLPPAGELGGRNQARKPGSDHDDVGVGHGGSLLGRPAAVPGAGQGLPGTVSAPGTAACSARGARPWTRPAPARRPAGVPSRSPRPAPDRLSRRR